MNCRRWPAAAVSFALALGGCAATDKPTAAKASSAPVNRPQIVAPPAAPSGPPRSPTGQRLLLVFGWGDPDEGPAPLRVRFTLDESRTELIDPKVEWDFGDGSPKSKERDPVHVYRRPGSYTAHLKVVDSDGVEDEDSVDILVEEPEAAGSTQ